VDATITHYHPGSITSSITPAAGIYTAITPDPGTKKSRDEERAGGAADRKRRQADGVARAGVRLVLVLPVLPVLLVLLLVLLRVLLLLLLTL